MEAIAILIVLGILVVLLWSHSAARRLQSHVLRRESSEKHENKLKILEELHRKKSEGESARITNNEVQVLLGVSDATATRYLDELQKAELLLQKGREGKHVYYEHFNGSTD